MLKEGVGFLRRKISNIKQGHTWKVYRDKYAIVLYEGQGSRKEMENPVHRIIRDSLYLSKEKSDGRENGDIQRTLRGFRKNYWAAAETLFRTRYITKLLG